MNPLHQALESWINQHFDQQVAFLQQLVRQPTPTPPGDNAPHAELTAKLLRQFGFAPELYPVPAAEVEAYGLTSLSNVIVRRAYRSGGPTVALNAHGDVVPPGEGWRFDPYGAQIEDGKLYGRAAAVSKSDFSTYTFAIRAIEAVAQAQLVGAVELHLSYDEEFGGEYGPGYLLKHQLTRPDYLIAAGFSYQVVNAHNGCLQLELTLEGKMAHAAIPDTGIDALQAATGVLNALYAQNLIYRNIRSSVPEISHPYLNVGRIEGGTNTNVVPGKVVLKLDRRMIPEENPAEVEQQLRQVLAQAVAAYPGVQLSIRRLLLAHALKSSEANTRLAKLVQRHAQEVMGEAVPVVGTPLYTDVRLYGEAGIPGVIYGAGPRTVLESGAKRSDEHIVLEDLRRATVVIARSLVELLQER